jgi:hypothetical protein
VIYVVIIDLTKTNCIDKLFVEDCRVDEAVQKRLYFLFIAQRSVHFVRFFLERGHLMFNGLKMALKVIKNILKFLHYTIGDS